MVVGVVVIIVVVVVVVVGIVIDVVVVVVVVNVVGEGEEMGIGGAGTAAGRCRRRRRRRRQRIEGKRRNGREEGIVSGRSGRKEAERTFFRRSRNRLHDLVVRLYGSSSSNKIGFFLLIL